MTDPAIDTAPPCGAVASTPTDRSYGAHETWVEGGRSDRLDAYVGGIVLDPHAGDGSAVSPVPLPATLPMLGMGLLAVAGLGRRRA